MENYSRQQSVQIEEEGTQAIYQSDLLEEKDLSHMLTNIQKEPSQRSSQVKLPSEVYNDEFSANMTINCKIHPSEAVKYFCKDDQTALCPECVVEHSRHDFIMANDNASRQVKNNLQ